MRGFVIALVSALVVGTLLTSATLAAPSPAPAAPGVNKVVFVDKEKCCPCTRKNVDASWTALSAVTKKNSAVAVERFHMDTDPARAEPFLKKKSPVALPALYFLNAGGDVVKMLQGAVKEAAIQEALK